jgi:hypothetical protein
MTVERTCCRHCPALMRYLSRISRRVQSGRPGPTWVAFDGFTSPLFSNDQDRTQQAVGIERLGENPSSDLLMDGGGRRRRSSCRCAWRLQAVGRPGRDTCRVRRSPTTAGSVAGSAVGADDVTSPEVGAGRCRLAAAPGERGGETIGEVRTSRSSLASEGRSWICTCRCGEIEFPVLPTAAIDRGDLQHHAALSPKEQIQGGHQTNDGQLEVSRGRDCCTFCCTSQPRTTEPHWNGGLSGIRSG